MHTRKIFYKVTCFRRNWTHILRACRLATDMSAVLSLILLSSILSSGFSYSSVADFHNCQDILSSIRDRSVDDGKTFTYQCRPGEDCGGIADRMAGIMSGLFFALLSERAFKIHWPGFDKVFQPQAVQWSFDEHNYGIPTDELRRSGLIGTGIGGGQPTRPFPSNPQAVIFNDLNSNEISNPAKWAEIASTPHVFFLSNRDPFKEMYQRVAERLQWPADGGDVQHGYYVAYRCLFNDIFTPSAAFFNSPYKPLDGEEVPFQDIMSVVEDFDIVSLAYHYRISDDDLVSDPEEARISDTEIEWLVNFAAELLAFADQRMNLFFVTNSMNSARKVAVHPDIRNSFVRVYSQELTSGVHINYQKGHQKLWFEEAGSSETLKQAMMDWWVMRHAHYLVCGGSGFCLMAAAVAEESQVTIDRSSKMRVLQNGVLFTNRYCDGDCYETQSL